MEEVRKRLYMSHDPYANFPVMPSNNHGWSSEHPAFEECIVQIRPKLIVEVGTWFGGSARNMARLCLKHGIEDFEIVCIDTFCGSVEMWDRTSYLMTFRNGRPIIYDQFISNTMHEGLQKYITPFPVDSENGFLTLMGLGVRPDMVYIDAGHDYHSVANDLRNWSAILKDGGILLGDDWHHPPIKEAVKDVLVSGTLVEHGAKFKWTK